MDNKRALITGGCGFVGRHFACRLVKDGFNVTIVDDLSSGLELNKWPSNTSLHCDVTFHHVDMRDYCRYTDETFDIVVHLAAVVGGRLTIEGVPLKVARNIAIDVDFFNWLAKCSPKPQKVIYFSSSSVYPSSYQTRAHNELLSENLVSFQNHIGIPDMTYGWSKLCGELLVKYAIEYYDLNIVIYRPFSGYGEDQSLDYPFPSIVKRAMETEPPMIIWGSGEQLRDFIHIDDIVEAVMITKDTMKSGEVLNLGTGVGVSFYELAYKILNIVGRDIPVICDRRKPEGVFSRIAQTENMYRYYKPKISLEDGIDRVSKFMINSL